MTIPSISDTSSPISNCGMMSTVECAGCQRPILDRFLLHFMDKTWHSQCVKCQVCRALLDDKCFFKEGKIYCRDDFYRCFGPKCSGCGDGILPQDYVRKARDRVYHLKCFACTVCRKQLATGEVLYLGTEGAGDENALLCKEDYLKTHQGDSLVFSDDEEEPDDRVPIPGLDGPPPPPGSNHLMPPHLPNMPPGMEGMPPGMPMQQHPNSMMMGGPPGMGGPKFEANNNEKDVMMHHHGGSNDGMLGGGQKDVDNESMDGDSTDLCKNEDSENKSPDGDGAGGKRRGPRTTIKAKQLEVLKTAFNQTPKPTRHIREQLAKETGLSMRVIQVWFQNKRSKERRMKQMTNGMMAARGFFPGKGGRRGFPLIGDEFGYFPGPPHDGKPYHDGFGYPGGFGPPPGGPDGFFPPGHMGFMGPPGPNMDQPLPMGGPMGGPPPMGPPMPPGGPDGPGYPPSAPGSAPQPNSSSDSSASGGGEGDNVEGMGEAEGGNIGNDNDNNSTSSSAAPPPSKTSPSEEFPPGSGTNNVQGGNGFNEASSNNSSDQQQQSEQMVW